MLEVSLSLESRTVLRLERDEWSMTERLRQEVTIEYAPAPPRVRAGSDDDVVYMKRGGAKKGRSTVYDR